MKISWKKIFYFVFLLGSMFGIKNAVGQNEKLILKSKSEENKLEKKYSINGIIYESDSITPIPFCNVSLLNSDSMVVTKTYTDFDGRFSFDKLIPNKYSLIISYIGYKTFVINDLVIARNTNLSTTLSPITINLNEVEIIIYKLCYLVSKYPEIENMTIEKNIPSKKEIKIETEGKKDVLMNSNEVIKSEDIKNMPFRR